jgi:hypothetical protein
MKALAAVTLSLVLLGADCDPPGPPAGYCRGAETVPSALDSVIDGIGGIWNTIIGGTISTDRRSTVRVHFGQSYCSGVVLTPHTVLTAAHCGYGAATTHSIRFDDENGTEVQIAADEHLYHPDYQSWIDNNDLEGRKADIMLLFTETTLPPPYTTKFYTSLSADACEELVAQGWGLDEFPDEPATLRESNYMVTNEEARVIRTKQAGWGGICFGDSGGPLYAVLGGGLDSVQVAGITSTTMSQDCLIGSTHVKLSAPVHKTWIGDNVR